MDPWVLHNGRILPRVEARLSPDQSGLMAGWGVFTTLRLYGGRPFEFPRHWRRMTRDAARLGLDWLYSEAAVGEQIVELARANQRPEGMARLWFVRNHGGLWADNTAPPATDLVAFTRELPLWPDAHRLLMVPDAVYSAGVLAGAKMLSWAQNTLLAERAHERGFDDALLLNERGELAECTSANIFLVRDGRVLTPPLSSGCLPGVTRDVLLEIGLRAGVEIEEETLRPDDLDRAREVFISSTTREVAGVRLVDAGGGKVLRWPVPGKITEALEAAFQRHVKSLER